MVEVGGRIVLAAVLVAASVAKLASPRSSSAALGTFGIRNSGGRWAAWGALIATELAIAAGVAAGLDLAAYLAAGLMAGFGVAMLAALRRGRGGAPCACFGARSTVSRTAVARNLVLSFAYVALPLLPEGDLSTDEWLALGLALALLACAGLAVAVLALAREVGMLRLRLGPAAALEIPEEGPPLGSRTSVVRRFDRGGAAELALAVFVSESCHVCRGLEPAIASLGSDPVLSLETFEEEADADVWRQLDVPGSPYAVALDPGGTVLAKGTFNNLAQLESVLATAERRRAGWAAVESTGV
ncbi:MAG: MauE/DoxX family redox-associated membrane protein [Solirubrobacterales bacterium]